MILPLKLNFCFHNNKNDNIQLIKLFLNKWLDLCEIEDDDYRFEIMEEIETISKVQDKESNYFNLDLPDDFPTGYDLVSNLIRVMNDVQYEGIEITYVQGNDMDSSLEIIKVYNNKGNFEFTYRFNESIKIYNYFIIVPQSELPTILNKDIIQYITRKGVFSEKELEKEITDIEDILTIEFNDNNVSNSNLSTEPTKMSTDILNNIIDNIEKGILNPIKNEDYYSINIMYLLLEHPKFDDVTEEEMLDASNSSLYSKTGSEILNRILKYYDENNISYTHESIEDLSIEEINELMTKINY